MTCLLLGICLGAGAQVQVKHLRCEDLIDPLGLGEFHPRLSWQLQGPAQGLMQTAYELRVGAWSSGRVASDASVGVRYAGPALEAGHAYTWQVRVWDNQGHVSPWSSIATWRMGLTDWKARWIVPGFEDTVGSPCPYFRKDFSLHKKIKSAVLFITAHGLYEAHINGARVGDAFLAPGWTSYKHRLAYQAYDVKDLLHDGDNDLGAVLGNGWYRGFIGYAWNKEVYGHDIALLAQLDITFVDGSTSVFATDASWQSSTGNILSSEIYNGETADERLAPANWVGVVEKDYDKSNLIWTENQPIRKHETFNVVHSITTPKGEKVFDFGQNLVGWVVLKVRGNAGDTIRLSHAEVLDKEGNFYTDNLRGAKAQDTYILRGGSEETLEPHFTFHGFRYIRFDKGDTRPEDVQAVALYSDMPKTGTWACSDTLLNQLQHNIQWGQRGNFLDVPTDCPQRDERLGWTGDAQVFSRTATFNMDVHDFFSKWLKDVSADQLPNGIIPCVIPNVTDCDFGSAGWADCATIIPWNMYLAYGDTSILRNQYSSMKAWVDHIRSVSTNDLWNKGDHFGDWLFFRPWDDNSGMSAVTDKYYIAQCFYIHSCDLLVHAAQVLGFSADVASYSSLLARIKAAFLREYVTPSGRLVSSTQTAYVLALQFDILPDSLRPRAVDLLVANVHTYGDHLTTGFLGASYLCPVLSRFGHTDLAYTLLQQETYPSWLYPVTKGATTIWERWDGIRTDGSLETPTMNSFNHYAYGAIGDWMYRVISGIDTYEDGPGYRHIRIQPHPGGRLTHAEATYETAYGVVYSGWSLSGRAVTMHVRIPANTRATVFVPGAASPVEVGSGEYTFEGSL